jgi:hypothetical protein
MSIAVFSSMMRLGLAIAALVLALATWIVVRRGRPRVGAILGIGTLAAGGALVGEALIALTVRLAAPSTASFNEYRWVFLSPYGRWGLYIGMAAVGLIVALSWRASRGSSAWRRAILVGLRGAAATAAMVVFLEPAIELRQVALEPASRSRSCATEAARSARVRSICSRWSSVSIVARAAPASTRSPSAARSSRIRPPTSEAACTSVVST